MEKKKQKESGFPVIPWNSSMSYHMSSWFDEKQPTNSPTPRIGWPWACRPHPPSQSLEDGKLSHYVFLYSPWVDAIFDESWSHVCSSEVEVYDQNPRDLPWNREGFSGRKIPFSGWFFLWADTVLPSQFMIHNWQKKESLLTLLFSSSSSMFGMLYLAAMNSTNFV